MENELNKINWSRELINLEDLIKRDNSTYLFLFILSIVISILLIFIYPILLFLSLTFSGFIIYAYRKNKINIPYAYLFKIKEKERWQRRSPVRYRNPLVQNIYVLIIAEVKKYKISASRPELIEEKNPPTCLHINSNIYNKFNNGESAFFIFSPAKDLIGYYYQGKIITLLKTETLSNGELFSVSISIPQEESYPPGDGFIKIKD